MSENLKLRTLVAIVGIPFLLFVFYKGGVILWIFLLIISILAQYEFNNIINNIINRELSKVNTLKLIQSCLVSICFYGFMTLYKPARFIPLFFILGMIAFIFLSNFYQIWNNSKLIKYLLNVIGLLYTTILPGLIFYLDKDYHEKYYLLLLIILIWITDSAAYFIGVNFGKHRGVFPVSPRKSLEGFIAGLIAPLMIVIIISQVSKHWSIRDLIIVSICAGFFGQIGDLLESKIKRYGKVKDSSNIIPGHGGILDRFDSLLTAAPILYLILLIVY